MQQLDWMPELAVLSLEETLKNSSEANFMVLIRKNINISQYRQPKSSHYRWKQWNKRYNDFKDT